MATKKTTSGGKSASKTTSKGSKQPFREPGFFSDYGGSGIVLDPPAKSPKKPSGGKKK